MPDPRQWESWFLEHPDGCVGFVLADGTVSPQLRTNEEVREYLTGLLERVEAGGPKIAQLVRARHAGDDPEEVIRQIMEDPKLYPPDDQGGDA
jgi:hypothetical protein